MTFDPPGDGTPDPNTPSPGQTSPGSVPPPPPPPLPPSNQPAWGAPQQSPAYRPPAYQPPPYSPPGYGGGYGMPAPAAPRPSNYLVPAILATLFCCLPGGIVSIVYAAQVNSKWDSGDYNGALNSAKNAKTWFWISFGVGLAISVFWVIAIIAGASSSNTSSYGMALVS